MIVAPLVVLSFPFGITRKLHLSTGLLGDWFCRDINKHSAPRHPVHAGFLLPARWPSVLWQSPPIAGQWASSLWRFAHAEQHPVSGLVGRALPIFSYCRWTPDNFASKSPVSGKADWLRLPNKRHGLANSGVPSRKKYFFGRAGIDDVAP
jgi:hypothetical protein